MYRDSALCRTVLASLLVFGISLPLAVGAWEPPRLKLIALEPGAIDTGLFRTQFSEPSPLATYPQLLARVLGKPAAEAFLREWAGSGKTTAPRYTLDVETESFEVYVPEHYQPDQAIGLMVYVPARSYGTPPDHYLSVLKERNMIFVAANKSGNDEPVLERRIPLALHALHNMRRSYNIDPERVYIAGISGGAKAASYLGIRYADLFTGALYIIGSHALDGSSILQPEGAVKDALQKRNRYVFLTGQHDFNRREIRGHFTTYQEFGAEHAQLLYLADMRHRVPARKNFLKAIRALEPQRD
jgi:hypothetical protein